MLLLSALLACSAFCKLAEAQEISPPWQPTITEHHTAPARLIAVDKSQQRLFLFEQRSPLEQMRNYICTTGKVAGDKAVEGDLKTPEGVYFVVQRIGSGLDFIKYGNEAYTLNYPNPVDRLRKKTGYGIWIHGRGEPLVPLQTEGCVAMINDDLASLNSVLLPGTPVTLANALSITPQSAEFNETARILEERVRGWANAWSNRSSDFFAFYDKDAYSLAQGEPFSRFQTQKERLFKMLPWIKIALRDIRILQGPGYWVTWFYQEYEAPNLTTNGVRRLYWSRTPGGEFKILGMEWAPGMTTGTLIASAEPAFPPLELAPRTEEQVARAAEQTKKDDTPTPPGAEPSGAGVQTPSALREVVLDHVEDESLGKMAEPPLASLLLTLPGNTGSVQPGPWTGGMPVPEDKGLALVPVPPPSPLASSLIRAKGRETSPRTADTDQGADTGRGSSPVLSQNSTAPTQELAVISQESESSAEQPPAPKQELAVISQENAASRADNPAAPPTLIRLEPIQLEPHTDPDLPKSGPEEPDPEKTDRTKHGKGQSLAESVAPTAPEAWKRLSDRDIYSRPATEILYPPGEEKDPPAKQAQPAPAEQAASSTSPTPQISSANLEQRSGREGSEKDLQIREASPAQVPSDLPAASVPPKTDDADISRAAARTTEMLEAWRKAWEDGNINAYMAFYAPNAKQGARAGAQAIRDQKEKLWSKNKPSNVRLSDLRISLQGKKICADMRQDYSDSKAQGDTGIKTVILENINGVWLITQEDWRALPNEAGN